MDLIKTERTLGAHIEFTTNCNLKCIYCAVQNEEYLGHDLDLRLVDQFVEQARSRQFLEITVSGHGETTIIPNWHQYCNRLLDQGVKLNIITNLSKHLSDDEVETFSRFNFILVSCDSIDLKIFKFLRRGSDFRTVLFNLNRITSRARQHNYHAPMIGWTTVVSDRNVLDLVSLVYFGLNLGVTFFSFSNVVIYKETAGPDSYQHITEMPYSDQKKIPGIFSEIRQILDNAGVTYEITAGIEESIEVIQKQAALLTEQNKEDAGSHIIYREQNPLNHGMTRDCLDPWNRILLRPDGGIYPCFVTEETMGNMQDMSLDEIMSGDGFRRYREGLLSGNMVDACVDCHCKGWIPVETMKAKVAQYLQEYDPNHATKRAIYKRALKQKLRAFSLQLMPLFKIIASHRYIRVRGR